MKSTELLLPVGNMKMALAAIHGGADAIYVGVPGFNARGRTQDFSIAELKEIIDLCHLYGVKVNLAFNVLIFEDEFPAAQKLLEEILPLGPDAFIVQDMGLAQLIRQMDPTVRLHASTQMTVTNHDAIELLSDLGFERFVLGRENSLEEIKLIREHTTKELEVFVHGALCVAYSGQCFTSESLGGRSANRGQCAQSCRLGYELFVDGKKQDLGDKQYLVSPQDLCAIEEVPELMRIGVNSFKVEGRLKTPEYVAMAAKNYSEVVRGEELNVLERQREMAMTYSRGFFTGWMHGVNHQRLVDGTYSSHRGMRLGTVERVGKDFVEFGSQMELRPGIGLLFENGLGGKVYSASRGPKGFRVELLRPFDYQKIKTGMVVWANSDDQKEIATKKMTTEREHMRRVALSAKLVLRRGMPAALEVSDGSKALRLEGAICQSAKEHPTTRENAEAELGALGTTVFKLSEFEFENSDAYISQKDLKILRRLMVEEITRQRVAPVSKKLGAVVAPSAKLSAHIPKLNVLLREKTQVDELIAYLKSGRREALGIVFLDFEFGKNYAPSLEALRAHGIKAGVATTRILKPKEYHNLAMIERLRPDAVLVRNLGALRWFKDKGIDLHGDFSLNASNSWSVDYLLSKGLKSVCLSYDLNQEQLASLLRKAPADRVEVTLHQYMPEFHMEHCVFAAFMSKGTSFKDCGKPCERHSVELKDSYGNMHFLKADQECRNTMFRGEAQSAAFMVDKHTPNWRFEALNEKGAALITKLDSYLALVQGEITVRESMQAVGVHESYGLSGGQIASDKVWRDRKKDGPTIKGVSE